MAPRIIEVATIENYTIKLTYETGETRIFDVAPYITGPWYGKLKNDSYFKTIHIASNGRGIEWEDGQDIAPHELYDLSFQAILQP